MLHIFAIARILSREVFEQGIEYICAIRFDADDGARVEFVALAQRDNAHFAGEHRGGRLEDHAQHLAQIELGG